MSWVSFTDEGLQEFTDLLLINLRGEFIEDFNHSVACQDYWIEKALDLIEIGAEDTRPVFMTLESMFTPSKDQVEIELERKWCEIIKIK